MLQDFGDLAAYMGVFSFLRRHTSWMYGQLGKRHTPLWRMFGQSIGFRSPSLLQREDLATKASTSTEHVAPRRASFSGDGRK